MLSSRVVRIYHTSCRTNVWPKQPATQTHSDPDCCLHGLCSASQASKVTAALRSVSEANEKYSSTNLSTKARRKWQLSLLVPPLWPRSETQERSNVITSRRWHTRSHNATLHLCSWGHTVADDIFFTVVTGNDAIMSWNWWKTATLEG